MQSKGKVVRRVWKGHEDHAICLCTGFSLHSCSFEVLVAYRHRFSEHVRLGDTSHFSLVVDRVQDSKLFLLQSGSYDGRLQGRGKLLQIPL